MGIVGVSGSDQWSGTISVELPLTSTTLVWAGGVSETVEVPAHTIEVSFGASCVYWNPLDPDCTSDCHPM